MSKTYIYIMRDEANGQYKIGEAIDPGRRLREIRQKRPQTNLIEEFEIQGRYDSTAEMGCQKAVTTIGLVRVNIDGTDWFNNPRNISKDMIVNAVRTTAGQYKY